MLAPCPQSAFVIASAFAIVVHCAALAADYSIAYTLEVEGTTEAGKI
jgi:hypothetical protein